MVSGGPAAGKSTLARQLAAELGLPLIAKDTIKDAIATVWVVPDVETSRRVGRAAVAVVLAVAEDVGSAVLDSVWHRTYAAPQLAALNAVVEVFCSCDRAVLQARFAARVPTRAAGHHDGDRTEDELWNDETCTPVAGGWPVIEVDTAGPVDVPALAARVLRARDLGAAGAG